LRSFKTYDAFAERVIFWLVCVALILWISFFVSLFVGYFLVVFVAVSLVSWIMYLLGRKSTLPGSDWNAKARNLSEKHTTKDLRNSPVVVEAVARGKVVLFPKDLQVHRHQKNQDLIAKLRAEEGGM
jgi:hypothetical protein